MLAVLVLPVLLVLLALVLVLVVLLVLLLVLVYWISKPLVQSYFSKPDNVVSPTFVDPTALKRTRHQFPSVAESASVYMSLIVPAFNEENRIGEMLKEVSLYHYSFLLCARQ